LVIQPASPVNNTCRIGACFRIQLTDRFALSAGRRRAYSPPRMLDDIRKVLFHESTILSRLDELAHEITTDYRGKDLTVIAILNGSFVFMADLLRRVPLPLQVDCLSVSSYHGTRTTGRVNFRQSLVADFSNRHVLLLDDILDSGHTLHAIQERLAEGGALSFRTCVLLRKMVERSREIDADYVAFDIPNEFVVGYGLDYNEKYRNLPFVGVLTEGAITRGARAEEPVAQ
jgi:hypoxanthine phosphoribosyltransferase